MKSIVITTIFPPTEAVREIAGREDWQLIVAGDRKTPREWNYGDAYFLSAQAQEARGFCLGSVLSWNHCCRKMIGYLEAIRLGAERIVDTDDNIPKVNRSFPETDEFYKTTREDFL